MDKTSVTEYGGGDTNRDVKYRVMVVDDSAFIRGAIVRALEGDAALQIVSSQSDGELAVKSLQREPVDIIVLDIEMPNMDGLTALPLLKAIDPAVQIIMASTLTQKNAEVSLKAMSLGATDYIAKPSTGREVTGADDFKRELREKVKALGALARRSGVRMPASAPTAVDKSAPIKLFAKKENKETDSTSQIRPLTRGQVGFSDKKEIVIRKEQIMRPDVIAIGSSTGGPQALFKVVKDMGADLPQSVVITQHMPPAFTAILADHISRQCRVNCTEAKDGEVLAPAKYYVAPGDFHMLVETKSSGSSIKLVKDQPENFCRPSVDPMLRSLVGVYGKRILTVILTGMGQDGMRGGEAVVKAGGAVIAQDEASSVVWGMPGAVAMAGLCSAILPIDEIGGFVRQLAMRPR